MKFRRTPEAALATALRMFRAADAGDPGQADAILDAARAGSGTPSQWRPMTNTNGWRTTAIGRWRSASWPKPWRPAAVLSQFPALDEGREPFPLGGHAFKHGPRALVWRRFGKLPAIRGAPAVPRDPFFAGFIAQRAARFAISHRHAGPASMSSRSSS